MTPKAYRVPLPCATKLRLLITPSNEQAITTTNSQKLTLKYVFTISSNDTFLAAKIKAIITKIKLAPEFRHTIMENKNPDIMNKLAIK